MIIDTHSHLMAKPDCRLIEHIIQSHAVDQAWIMEVKSWAQFASKTEMLAIKKTFAPFFRMFAYLDFYSDPGEIKRLKDQGFDGLKSIWPGRPYNHP